MNTLTRSSDLMTSSVGPSRFASTGVRVFVSERCIFFCSSGTFVSSGPGRGACIASVIDETLVHDSEHLTGGGKRHDPRAVNDIDAPDGIPGTFDLADVNPSSDPYPELRICSCDR